MAKSKYSTALYEVISNRSEEANAAGSKAPALGSKPARADQVGARTKQARTAGRSSNAAGDDGSDSSARVRFSADRVEVSLNAVSAAVVVGVVLLGMFTSYQLGAMLSGGDSATVAVPDQDGAGELADVPVDPGVLAMGPSTPRPLMGTGPAEPSRQPAASPERGAGASEQPVAEQPAQRFQGRQAGLNYVVLARFKAEHKEEALHVAGWLADKQGIATVLEKHGELWWLISTEGFDYSIESDKRRCREFCDTLQTLSTAYKNEFKGQRVILYSFHDPEVRKF